MAEQYRIGVMKTLVEQESPLDFDKIVESAVKRVEETLTDDVNVQVEVFEFNGPHLTPVAGAYSPLDFLQLGLSEKLERDTHFLLITTEVDLSAATLSYVLALPSELWIRPFSYAEPQLSKSRWAWWYLGPKGTGLQMGVLPAGPGAMNREKKKDPPIRRTSAGLTQTLLGSNVS